MSLIISLFKIAVHAHKPQTHYLVYVDNSIPYVVQGDLSIAIAIQHIKGLLSFLRLKKVLQILRQDVCSAERLTTIMY